MDDEAWLDEESMSVSPSNVSTGVDDVGIDIVIRGSAARDKVRRIDLGALL